MEEFYDIKHQVLIIKHHDFMNREARIPTDSRTYEILERISRITNARLRNFNFRGDN